MVNHATVQITETYLGNGTLDYDAYLTEISKLPAEPPLMIEHLSEAELPQALAYAYAKADRLGLSFRHADKRR